MKTIWTTALMSACLIAPVANAQNTSGQAPTLPLYNAQAWIFTPDIAADEVIHQLTDMTCPMSLPGGYTLHTVAQMAQGVRQPAAPIDMKEKRRTKQRSAIRRSH